MYDLGQKRISWGKLKAILADQPDDALVQMHEVTQNLMIFHEIADDPDHLLWIGFVDVASEELVLIDGDGWRLPKKFAVETECVKALEQG